VRPRPELPTLLMAALPGLPSSSLEAATIKRPAIRAPESTPQKMPVANEPGAFSPPERIDSAVVEAQTISLVEEPDQDCSEIETRDFPLLPEQAVHAAEEATTQPDPVSEMEADTLRQRAIVDARTQDFPHTGDLADAATQEFRSCGEVGDITTQELLPLSA